VDLPHDKMLESQITQQASSSSTSPSRLPSKHKMNSKDYGNGSMRSGKQLEDPKDIRFKAKSGEC